MFVFWANWVSLLIQATICALSCIWIASIFDDLRAALTSIMTLGFPLGLSRYPSVLASNCVFSKSATNAFRCNVHFKDNGKWMVSALRNTISAVLTICSSLVGGYSSLPSSFVIGEIAVMGVVLGFRIRLGLESSSSSEDSSSSSRTGVLGEGARPGPDGVSGLSSKLRRWIFLLTSLTAARVRAEIGVKKVRRLALLSVFAASRW